MKKADKEVCNKFIQGMKKIPKAVKNELCPLVQKLLTKCSSSKVLTKKAEWDEIEEILDLLKVIQDIEKEYPSPLPDRNCHWERFYEWCSENGAKFESVEVSLISEGNFGLIAKRDIEENETFLTVPRKLMMSETSAKNSRLGPLIDSDPILQHMPNIQVAMHLVSEFLDPKSFWLPYISILPSSYSTILYFTMKEMKEFQKSPVIDEVFKILRSVIRQYCYFFQLLEKDSYAKSLNISPYFTFDLYRWAVSCTMTRQNFLPSPNGGQPQITSLVPLFDMCNHTNGRLSTDFSLEKDSLISYSFKPFLKDNEIFMFYGPRTNAEFLVHNGFVYPENVNDSLEIKFGISKNDPLFTLKNDVCSRLNVSVNGPFYLSKEKLSTGLLRFLIVTVMKSDELEDILNDKNNDRGDVLEESADFKKRALSFLKDRVNLLIKSYGTTIEEDENLLKQSVLVSVHYQLAVQLRVCEKRILSQTYNYCIQSLT